MLKSGLSTIESVQNINKAREKDEQKLSEQKFVDSNIRLRGYVEGVVVGCRKERKRNKQDSLYVTH